jgi:hypothetical protein
MLLCLRGVETGLLGICGWLIKSSSKNSSLSLIEDEFYKLAWTWAGKIVVHMA